MSKISVGKIKRVIPSLLLLALVAALAGLSFLPSVRGRSKAVVALNDSIDGEAVSALGICRAYIATNDFSTKMDGTVKAKVFGIPYVQKIYGGRTVSGENFTETAESVSAFVKAGIKKSCDNDKYTVSRAKHKNKKFVYGEPSEYDRNGYVSQYGLPPVGLVKYDIDNSIVSARKVDDNTYTFELETRRATVHSRNEIRSLLGGDSYPDYENVEFTLFYDGVRPIKVVSRENFRIDKFGGTHCSAEYTETFEY